MVTTPSITKETLNNQTNWIIEHDGEVVHTDSEVKARQFITRFLDERIYKAATELVIRHISIPDIQINVWRGAELLARQSMEILQGKNGPCGKFAGKSNTWFAGIDQQGLACNCPQNKRAPIIHVGGYQHRMCKHVVAYITHFKLQGGL